MPTLKERYTFTPLLQSDLADGGPEFEEIVKSIEEEIKEKVRSDDVDQKKQDSEWQTERKRLETLEASKSVLTLFRLYIYARASFVIDIVVMVMFFYYLDVLLDLQMMYSFWCTGQFIFLAVNSCGIFLGLLATFMQLVSLVRRDQQASGTPGLVLLILGFTIPFQMHVLFLGGYSLHKSEKTVFLYTAKLMESVVESTISSVVQTYALIFNQLEGYSMYVAYASIMMSYLSISYCYTSFDLSTVKKILGFPGRAKGFFRRGIVPGALSLVFLARICECTSRMISFALVLRGVYDCKTAIGHYGSVAALLGIDFTVIMILTTYEQACKLGLWSNLTFGIFSVFCYVNPILERKNVTSCKYYHYYIWRVLELGLMAYLSLRCTTYRQLRDDVQPELLYAFVCSTAGWLVLFPIIRLCLVKDGFLEWTPEMFGNEPFTNTEQIFRDSLLYYPKPGPNEKSDQRSKATQRRLERTVEFHLLCSNVLSKSVERLEKFFEIKDSANKKFGRAGQKLAGLGAAKGLPKAKSQTNIEVPSPPKAEDSKDESSSCTCDQKCMKSVHWWLFGFLMRDHGSLKQWIHLTKRQYKGQEDMEASVWVRFHALKFTAANLAPYLKQAFLEGDCYVMRPHLQGTPCTLTSEHQLKQADLYRRILRSLNHHLRQDDKTGDNVSLTSGPDLAALAALIPPVRKFRQGYGDMQLFTEKCRFVYRLFFLGLEESPLHFRQQARKLLDAFNAKSQDEIEFVENPQRVDNESWKAEMKQSIIKEQAHALILMFEKTPPKLGLRRSLFSIKVVKEDEEQVDNPADQTRESTKEIKAILEGAQCHKKERNASRVVTLQNVHQRKAMINALDSDLRLVVQTERRKEQDLGDLQEEHKVSLREVGLRGTDVPEEFVLMKVDGSDVLDKSLDSVKQLIFDESSKTKELPSLNLEFGRLLELDPRSLKLSDLIDPRPKAPAWNVNRTELLQICKILYATKGGSNGWMREDCATIMTEFDEIRALLEKDALAQVEKSRAEIEAWANRKIHPKSSENVLIEPTSPKNSEDEVRTMGQTAKAKNMEQIDKLKGVEDRFFKFIEKVKEEFGWNKETKGKCNEQVGKLVQFRARLERESRKYWDEFDSDMLQQQQAKQQKDQTEQLSKAREEAEKLQKQIALKDKECEMLKEQVNSRNSKRNV